MEFLQNIAPREYQKKIFETCKEKNCLVVLPTGLGKTLIALMLTIYRMKEFPGEKVLFLAPTRPLAEQHLESFKDKLPELFAGIEIFTGSIKPKERKSIWKKADIIFSTPQCIANDVKKNLYTLENVCLLVEDEAHRCIKNYAYNYVAQTYKRQAKNKRILGLTASPGSNPEKVKNICRNLSIEAVELRTRESLDVKQYLQELEFEKIKVKLPATFVEIQVALKELFDEYIKELKNRKLLHGPTSKTNLIRLQKSLGFKVSQGKRHWNILAGLGACAQAIKIQHALELIETQTLESFHTYLKKLFNEASQGKSKSVQRLVAKPKFNFAFTQTQELLSKNIEHPKINELINIIEKEKNINKKGKLKAIVFTQYRETARLISQNINDIKNIKSKVFVGQAIKKHGKDRVSGLSQKEQKRILRDFSDDNIDVLCATSIGEEGLDIPEVNLVIFYEPIPSAIRAIQRAGRTARLNPGKLIMLITEKTRDESHFYVSQAKRKKMHSTIKSIKSDLSENKVNFKSSERQKTL